MVGAVEFDRIDREGPPGSETATYQTQELPAAEPGEEDDAWNEALRLSNPAPVEREEADEGVDWDDDPERSELVWDDELVAERPRSTRPREPEVAIPEAVLVDDGDPLGLDDPRAGCLILATGEEERRFPLGDLHVLVGRSPSADIVTTGDGVALFHVRIEPIGDGRHRVIDLDARSGTLRNGEPIEEAVLEPGDRLRLGDTEFRYGQGLLSRARPPRPAVALRSPRRALLPSSSESSSLLPVLSEGGAVLHVPVEPVPAEPERRPTTVTIPDEPDLIDGLARLVLFGRRYRALLAVLPLLGLLAGLLSLRYAPPATVAEFELSLVQDPSDNPVDSAGRRTLTFFRSAQDNFLSPTLISRTLEQRGEVEPDPVAIQRVQSMLTFDRSSQFIYHGRFESQDSDEAVAFLQTHLDLFLETEVDKAIKVLTAEVETLQGQLAEIDDALTSVETMRVAFREEAGEAQPEHTGALQQRLMALRDDRRGAAKATDHFGASVDIARQRFSSEDKIIEQRIEDAKPFSNEIVATEQELISARASGQGPMHPNVKGLQARLEGLEDRHEELLEKGGDRIEVRSNPAYTRAKLSLHEAKSMHKVARADLVRTDAEIERIEGMLEKLPAREAEKAALDRRYKSLQTQHDELQVRLGHSRLQLALERRQVEARFDLVQPPTIEPHSSQQMLLARAGMGTALGLLIAIALGTGHRTWERVDQRITTRHQVVPPSRGAEPSLLALEARPRALVERRTRAPQRSKRRVRPNEQRRRKGRRRS